MVAVVGHRREILSRARGRRLPGVGELALPEAREQPPRLDDLLARRRAPGERAARHLAEALDREVALQQRCAAALGGADERARRLVEQLVVPRDGGRRER
jgi:hypothetical protein